MVSSPTSLAASVNGPQAVRVTTYSVPYLLLRKLQRFLRRVYNRVLVDLPDIELRKVLLDRHDVLKQVGRADFAELYPAAHAGNVKIVVTGPGVYNIAQELFAHA